MPDDQPPVIEAIAAEDTICVDWTFTIGTWFLAYYDPKIGAALNANMFQVRSLKPVA
jgi:hypothetical protein